MATRKVHLKDSQEALMLFGQHDQNLRALEQHYNVQIFGRGHVLSIRGAPGRVEKALLAIEDMRENLGRERRGVELIAPIVDGPGEAAYTSALGKAIRPKTAMQKTYINAIMKSDMVVAIGPARTGKTYLAVACALASLKAGEVARLILTRPVVEAGEQLGFLPA